MLSSLIAERYAKALLRAAQAEGALEAVGAQALALRAALHYADGAAAFLADPVSEPGSKLKALEASFPDGPHPILRQFLVAVLEMKREAFLAAILESFEGQLDEAQGRLQAQWGSAHPLPATQRKLIEAELSRRTGRQVQLQPYEDASLLGGSVLQIGDTVYDASLRTQLKRLGQVLAQGPTLMKAPAPAKAVAAKPVKKAPAAKAKPKVKAKPKPQPKAKTKAEPKKAKATKVKAQPAKRNKATKAGQALADKLFKK